MPSGQHTLWGYAEDFTALLLLGQHRVASRMEGLCCLPARGHGPDGASRGCSLALKHSDSSTGSNKDPCGCDKDHCSVLPQGCWQKPQWNTAVLVL